jgi:hypothetical protein
MLHFAVGFVIGVALVWVLKDEILYEINLWKVRHDEN